MGRIRSVYLIDFCRQITALFVVLALVMITAISAEADQKRQPNSVETKVLGPQNRIAVTTPRAPATKGPVKEGLSSLKTILPNNKNTTDQSSNKGSGFENSFFGSARQEPRAALGTQLMPTGANTTRTASSLSVLISADNNRELTQQLENFLRLSRRDLIHLGFLGISLNKTPEQLFALRAEIVKLASSNLRASPSSSLALELSRFVGAHQLSVDLLQLDSLVERFSPEFSPFIAISHAGVVYSYEGKYNGNSLFSRSGEFVESITNLEPGAENLCPEQLLNSPYAHLVAKKVAARRQSFEFSSQGPHFALVFRPQKLVGKKSASCKHDQGYRAAVACQGQETKRIAIFQKSAEMSSLDVLYFDPLRRDQQLKASRYPGRAVAYKRRLTTPGESPSFWQSFSRFLTLPCLPARFRFSEVSGQRYMELTTGEAAWNYQR